MKQNKIKYEKKVTTDEELVLFNTKVTTCYTHASKNTSRNCFVSESRVMHLMNSTSCRDPRLYLKIRKQEDSFA